MEFQAQTITVKTAQGEKSFPVMVGVGSGLAYHHLDNDPDADFILTHVASGFGIASEWYAWEEKDARRWLEKVANLLDWTQPLIKVKSAVKRRGGMDVVREQVTQALREAWVEGNWEAPPEPEPIEDGIPPNWPEEPLSIKTIRD